MKGIDEILKKIRLPNTEEKEQLKKYFMERYKLNFHSKVEQDEETANETVNNYWYVVFENYISDCPAYSGKLMVAVYGLPELHEVFIWDKEGLIKKVVIP